MLSRSVRWFDEKWSKNVEISIIVTYNADLAWTNSNCAITTEKVNQDLNREKLFPN
jgi:hypothetical protein